MTALTTGLHIQFSTETLREAIRTAPNTKELSCLLAEVGREFDALRMTRAEFEQCLKAHSARRRELIPGSLP